MAAKVKTDYCPDGNYDLMFEFNDVKLLVLTDPSMYTDNETKQIEDIVQHMSKQILIDKSYVTFQENKHCDTFIELDGWNSLCKLVKKTKFGKKSSNAADEVIIEAFKAIVAAYIYDVLEKFGYDIEGINVDFLTDSGIDVKFYKDTIQEWKHYVGPWQDWNRDSEHS